MSIDKPAPNSHQTYDLEYILRCLRGEITTDDAYTIIKGARALYEDGNLDLDRRVALRYGDGQHCDDTRRFERLEQTWHIPDLQEDPETVAQLETLIAERPDPYIDPELDEFLNTLEPDYEWIVEGLLERHDRVIVTAAEGSGKSTLLRQLAVQLASGLHPFTLDPIQPLQVLYIDCENSARQVRRKLRDLRKAADINYQTGQLRLRVLGHAIDLADPAIEEDLAIRITTQAVDVIIIGPLYKLLVDDPVKEMPAKAVADAIDRLRAIRGSAVIIEAHSPYAEGNGKKRVTRPYGASLWSRWPEFGIHIADTGNIVHWRGQREERAWPKILEHSQPWPWAPAPLPAEDGDGEWHGPTKCADAIVTILAELGEELSLARIKTELRARNCSYGNQTIADAAAMAHRDGRLSRRNGPRNSLMYRSHNGQETIDDTL